MKGLSLAIDLPSLLQLPMQQLSKYKTSLEVS